MFLSYTVVCETLYIQYSFFLLKYFCLHKWVSHFWREFWPAAATIRFSRLWIPGSKTKVNRNPNTPERGAPYLEWEWSGREGSFFYHVKWWYLHIAAIEVRKRSKGQVFPKNNSEWSGLFWLTYWFKLHYFHMGLNHCCSTMTQAATSKLWSTV